MRTALNFGIILLIALVFTVAPGGGETLGLLLTLLAIAFFAAIGFFGYRMYREHHFTLDSLAQLDRGVLYGSVGLAFLSFAAAPRLFEAGGAWVLVWIMLLATASFGVFWVWRRANEY
jgi:hypothetical protein